MKTLLQYLSKPWVPVPLNFWHILALLIISWLAIPYVFNALQLAAGFVDLGILHVVLLGFCCWLLAVAAAYHLLRYLLLRMGLPAIHQLIAQFKLLKLWEQYLMYLACYALLLCSAIGALIAIC
ncbi:hypothetical protein [Pedobacter sp. SL55]|uniref:hypothetical protein n=1 Tax=Pedobacter sp. SL55 TaxID=2995161 RepID=UPI002270970B|nr:hypothetical protein [Pedobacter sp. SL55]WAC39048.1 hypothetical protein OVA16_10510 [Pedobacter sp. SL55]